MRKLILMRHAQSDAGAPDLPDHERPLSGRGRQDVPRMARWLAAEQLIPEIILASTAARVRETVETLRGQWTDPPPVSWSDDLYLAPPEMILRTVRGDAMDCTSVMVVAHNPGLAALVAMLGRGGAPKRPPGMPTAAVAAFALSIDQWRRLSTESPVASLDYGCPEGLGD